MRFLSPRSACWKAIWSPRHPDTGIEHVCLVGRTADSALLAIDEDGEPFRLGYRLSWDAQGRLRRADLRSCKGLARRRLALRGDAAGHWTDGSGTPLPALDGCVGIDIWPTPLTNSFPLWRAGLRVGERRGFRMAWVRAPELVVQAKAQAYTRCADRLYRFESLDGSGFECLLRADEEGLVLDYPGLFERIGPAAATAKAQ